jgi:NAD(P)H-hydrate epimerase
LDAQIVAALLPLRPVNAHKGDFGRVLIVAGSRGMAGAAALCAMAALRGGAGLVTVACPEDALPVVQHLAPCATAIPLPQQGRCASPHAGPLLLRAARSADTLALGPGLGDTPWLWEVLSPLFCLDLPTVVDADALNAMAKLRPLPRLHGGCVLTPHPGEAARLLGISAAAVNADREGSALALHRHTGASVLLKGAHTLITDGADITRNPTGCEGMATGGSGDVLAGLVAGLAAQGMPPYQAACVGAFLHGLAGQRAQAAWGSRGMTAWEIAEGLAESIASISAP